MNRVALLAAGSATVLAGATALAVTAASAATPSGSLKLHATPLQHKELGKSNEVEADADGQGMAIKFVYREGDPEAQIARTVEQIMSDSLGPRLYTKLMEQAHKRKGAS